MNDVRSWNGLLSVCLEKLPLTELLDDIMTSGYLALVAAKGFLKKLLFLPALIKIILIIFYLY